MNNKTIKQFTVYLFVGGAATVVEWVCFRIFNNALDINYMLSTALAFILSTFANFVLGRKTAFKAEKSRGGIKKEIVSIYGAAVMGLIFNLVLMYFFVSVKGLDSFAAKVIATCIVFFWNFFIRKFFIYRQ